MIKIGFSVATPEVNTPLLPAQQGELGPNLDILAELGYDGVEVSIRQPAKIDPENLKTEIFSPYLLKFYPTPKNPINYIIKIIYLYSSISHKLALVGKQGNG